MATEPSTFYRGLRTVIHPFIIAHLIIIPKNYHTKAHFNINDTKFIALLRNFLYIPLFKSYSILILLLIYFRKRTSVNLKKKKL